MKKHIALVLALVLCLSLCACGGSNDAPEATTPPVMHDSETEANIESESKTWYTDLTVDEFGDVTEDSIRILKALISGDFSNTATDSSDLGGCIFIMPDSTGSHFTVSFRLMEYGDNPVTYLPSDAKDITLKIKVEDEITEYSLYSVAPTGDLYLGLDDETDGDYFVDYLYLGYDIRCIITIGSSQYNFTVSSDDFTEAFQNTYEVYSSQDALKVFFSEKYRRAGTMYLLYSSNDLVPVKGDELSEILPGYWKTKWIETNSYASFYEYTEDGRIIKLGKFITDKLIPEDGKERQYYIEDNIVCSDDDIYEYNKIIDGYYLVIYRSSWGGDSSYIYIECHEDGTPVYPLV